MIRQKFRNLGVLRVRHAHGDRGVFCPILVAHRCIREPMAAAHSTSSTSGTWTSHHPVRAGTTPEFTTPGGAIAHPASPLGIGDRDGQAEDECCFAHS